MKPQLNPSFSLSLLPNRKYPFLLVFFRCLKQLNLFSLTLSLFIFFFSFTTLFHEQQQNNIKKQPFHTVSRTESTNSLLKKPIKKKGKKKIFGFCILCDTKFSAYSKTFIYFLKNFMLLSREKFREEKMEVGRSEYNIYIYICI